MKSKNKKFSISQMITIKETESLKSYLDSVSSIPMITQEREVELSKEIKKGSQEALEELVSANLRFVISVAKKFQHQGLSIEDLISEGNLGLIRAAQRFEGERGFKFITFALWWIRQSIVESITMNGKPIRLPLNRIRDMAKIKKAFNEFNIRENRDPVFEEIVNLTGLSGSKVATSMKSFNTMSSLDEPIGEEFTLSEILSDGSSFPSPSDEKVKGVNQILETLNEREGLVIKMLYGIGGEKESSMEEISKSIGLGKERIRQIRESALRKLRGGPRGNFLKKLM